MRLVCTPVGRGGLTEAAGQHPREADTGCCALWGTLWGGGRGEVSGGAAEPLGGHQAEAAVSSMKLGSRQVAMRLSLIAILLKP